MMARIGDMRRVEALMRHSIRVFSLDLGKFVVLTEAASGFYALTPLIAALAGAKTVLALTRDSRYGSAAEVKQYTMELAKHWGVENRLVVLDSREDPRVGQADIVTNLGFVRPLDATLIARLKSTAVVPLMWETWEYRPSDLDLDAARSKGLCVLGTNEHHETLRTFDYIGHLALKMLYEVQVEVFGSRIAVLGRGEFAAIVANLLEQVGARVRRVSTEEEHAPAPEAVEKVVSDAEALIVVDHESKGMLIGGEGAPVSSTALASWSPGVVVVHICGGVDRKGLVNAGIRCWPEAFAPVGSMSVTTEYLGPRPLVDLHSAGLKVGEMLALERRKGLGAFDAECSVLRQSALAQGFAGYHPFS